MARSTISRRELLGLSGVLAVSVSAGAAESERRKVVIVGAHPDDPETGCGGTAARLSDAGHDVVFAYLTRGEAGIEGVSHAEAARTRTGEAETAARILGARTRFLGQIDGATEITGQRYEECREMLRAEAPDLVLTHWPIDTHRDHRVAALLAYDAWLGMDRSFALYYYEVMTGTQTQTFQPTDYVDISTTMERKHQASFAHRSQGIEREYARYHGAMEVFRGMERGCAHAEAFVRHSMSSTAALPTP